MNCIASLVEDRGKINLLDICPDAIGEAMYDIAIRFHFERQYFSDSMPRKGERVVFERILDV